MSTDDEPQEGLTEEHPLTVDELVRAATRLVMGSAGIAVSSATKWQRGVDDAEGAGGAGAAGNLTSAALGLGLATERAVVRGASKVGGTAAWVTWSVVNATPFRVPIARLSERFRGEQRLSEREVSDALDALLDALGAAVLARVDIDRLIDRVALERVLARFDRREIEARLGTERSVGG